MEGGNYNQAAALRAAERDWLTDSDGGKPLDRSRFEAALFELADVYTDSIDEGE